MAEDRIQLEIVTPAHRVLSQAASEVRLPGAGGGFGVKPGHTPFITALKAGELVVVSAGGPVHFAVGEGFVQVAEDRITVLTEAAERAEEIELGAAQEAVRVETEKLRAMRQEEAEYELQRAKVERAAARVLVAGRR